MLEAEYRRNQIAEKYYSQSKKKKVDELMGYNRRNYLFKVNTFQ